ncbi:hypothetical protein [Amycolatopsis sp. cmx-8-4]|uniref:hypothetical protein n=1 Tax=Amycolatopsis sp. cmx-8-4 TaxID=2790947 RepID=UPI00397E6764
MARPTRLSMIVGVIAIAACAAVAVLLPGKPEVAGFAIASPHPVFPTEHVYNRQDLAGYLASDAAATMLARGYTDVLYATDSSRVPSDKGCTPGETVGVYGVDSSGVVYLQTFMDLEEWQQPTQYDLTVSARLARCAR